MKSIEYNDAVEAYILLSAFVREKRVVPELYDVEKIRKMVLYLAKAFDEDPVVLQFVKQREAEVKDFKPVEIVEKKEDENVVEPQAAAIADSTN